MFGPMGGGGGAAFRPGKGQRRMMTKGLRMGSYVRLVYQGKDGGNRVEERAEYEGKIVDKRIGGEDRESYVELQNCLKLNAEGQIISTEKKQKFIDAFIVECEVVEKVERQIASENTAAAMLPGVGQMTMSPMAMAMPQMMPMPMMGMPAAMSMMHMGMPGMPMMMGMPGMTGMPNMGMPGMGMGGMMAMPMMGMPAMATMPQLATPGADAFATGVPQAGINNVDVGAGRERSRSRKRSR